MSHPDYFSSGEGDKINNMLPPEFHTNNGIPTDPDSHALFYVSRTRAVLVQVLTLITGVGAGAILGYYHSATPPWYMALLAVVLMIAAMTSLVFLDERRKS